MERLLTLYSEVQATGMYGGCGIPLLQSGKLHCCRVILEMGNRL